MSINRVVIVGAGAIGGSIGGLLHHSGVDVTLVARGEHGKIIRDDGLVVKFPGREIRCRANCVDRVDCLDWSDGDVCLVATKLNDAKDTLSAIRETAGEDIPIICAFNGLQGERWAAEKFAVVATIMIWMPSTHLFPGDIRVYGEGCPGVLDIGAVKGGFAESLSQTAAETLRSANFDSEFRSDIEKWKYAKLITNLGNTAQALITDDWQSVAEAAQTEGENVMDSSKIARIATSDLYERCEHIRLGEIAGEKRSGGSTWQSLRRGRALETKWIEGEIVRLAEIGNMKSPVNLRLSDLAKTKTKITADQFFATL